MLEKKQAEEHSRKSFNQKNAAILRSINLDAGEHDFFRRLQLWLKSRCLPLHFLKVFQLKNLGQFQA